MRESRERVRSALLNSGYEFSHGRITVNLSPADLPKEGGRFDLARNVLEALREPLESGVVVMSRARRSCEFPARFQLVAPRTHVRAAMPAIRAAAAAARRIEPRAIAIASPVP